MYLLLDQLYNSQFLWLKSTTKGVSNSFVVLLLAPFFILIICLYCMLTPLLGSKQRLKTANMIVSSLYVIKEK